LFPRELKTKEEIYYFMIDILSRRCKDIHVYWLKYISGIISRKHIPVAVVLSAVKLFGESPWEHSTLLLSFSSTVATYWPLPASKKEGETERESGRKFLNNSVVHAKNSDIFWSWQKLNLGWPLCNFISSSFRQWEYLIEVKVHFAHSGISYYFLKGINEG